MAGQMFQNVWDSLPEVPNVSDYIPAMPNPSDYVPESVANAMTWSGVRNKTKIEKLWSNDIHSAYLDATFFGELIVYITSESDEKSTIRVLDHKGEPSELPFPVYLTQQVGLPLPLMLQKPVAVCGNQDGSRLAIVHFQRESGYQINIYYKRSTGDWKIKNITTTHRVQRVALMPDGRCVCTTIPDDSGCELVLFNLKGQVQFVKQLKKVAAEPLPAYVSTTPSGQIVTSNTSAHSVIVRDDKGKSCGKIDSSKFLIKPSGVCVDSRGEVLIYDCANQTVSLFTTDNAFVREVLVSKEWIIDMSLCLYQDKFLLCIDYDGFHMYELK